MSVRGVPQDPPSVPSTTPSPRLWAVVLAGGKGSRLRPLVQRIHPDGRPKQFAVLMGDRSLLQLTLDRAALAIPADRTVVVTTGGQSRFLGPQLSGSRTPKVLVQSHDRGTAAGMLLPANWIAWKDPGAVIAVFPSDHFVADDAAFVRHVTALGAIAERYPDRIHLVGAEPDSAETGYGWIAPGITIERTLAGEIKAVDRFVEKPTLDEARSALRSGGLWNTFVMVARAATFVEAGRRALPELHERLQRIRPFAESDAEARAIDRAYALAPEADFSRSVLTSMSARLAVSRLPQVGWSDWGTPERVIATLQHRGIAPAWLRELATTA